MLECCVARPSNTARTEHQTVAGARNLTTADPEQTGSSYKKGIIRPCSSSWFTKCVFRFC